MACRYNMSYIIQQGALNDKPVLGVSINYRLAAFGFLDSEEVRVRYIYSVFTIGWMTAQPRSLGVRKHESRAA